MDRRVTPVNDRVAAAHLFGSVEGRHFVAGSDARISTGLADLLRDPDGARDRQLLLGAPVQVYEERNGWAFVQAAQDDYCGYVRVEQVDHAPAVTHRVSARATHVYPAPDFKQRERESLSMGALIEVTGIEGRFAETARGFIPLTHLLPVEEREVDAIEVADRLLGTPYLWGGNSSFGIDCSGLVQAGLFAVGQACPGDSDLQEAALGETLPEGMQPERGDLLFWKGHVAWVADEDTLLHANAFHMAVAYEPLKQAIARIADQGDGPVTRHARLPYLRRTS